MKKLGCGLAFIGLTLLPAVIQAEEKTTPPPLAFRFLFQPQVQLTEKDALSLDKSRGQWTFQAQVFY